MLEIRITAPEISEAINNLARALSGKSDNKMEIAATTAQRFLVPSDIPKYIAYLKENFGFSDADIQTVSVGAATCAGVMGFGVGSSSRLALA